MRRDFFCEPAPRFCLLRTGGLVDGDFEISHFAFDLVARQKIEPADEDRQFDDRRLGTVQPFKRRMVLLAHDTADKAWPLRMSCHAIDCEFGMGKRGGKPRHWKPIDFL